MVLDDAVVDDRDAVVRDVRVRVALAGHAVSSPARMRDAERPVSGVRSSASCSIFTLPTVRRRLSLARAVQHGDAGGVVAAVFEPAQTLHQDGNDVALGDGSNDSAHLTVSRNFGGASLPEWGARIAAGKPVVDRHF